MLIDADLPIIEDESIVNNIVLTPISLAFSDMLTREDVFPDPEPIKRISFSSIEGVVVSPIICTRKPRCINRIAKDLITKPVLPAPATKIL